ncbi:MAG TPA: hypothetical protein VGB76_06635, partial [Pyrinomonadaceae bacterium]
LIGILFPLVAHRIAWVRWVSLAALCSLALLLPLNIFLFHYLFLFALGILAFFCSSGKIGRRTFVLALPAFCAGLYLTMGAAIAAVGAAVAASIVFVPLNNSFLNFFGAISYSLYLLHVPLGGKVINLGARFEGSSLSKILTLLAAFGLSVGAAYLFYRFVERPSQRWCSSISYRRAAKPEESYSPTAATSLCTPVGVAE